jgi:hypothetical protein
MTTTRRTAFRPPAVLLALTIVAGACGSPAPTAAPTPSPSAAPSTTAGPPPSPSAPASPSAIPSDTNAALYAEIESQVEALRGLKPTGPVPRQVLDEAGLSDYITRVFRTKNPESVVAADEALYRALLLMPDGASLESLYIKLVTTQVLGVYDEDTKTMYIVSRKSAPSVLDEATYAHEFTHALQDQAFGIVAVRGDPKGQSDRTLARMTLIEGDAYLTMGLWAQSNLTPEELLKIAGMTDPAAEAALASLPGIVKEPLLFPATKGFGLALGDYSRGGFEAIDRRFADPPDSTEQILHPDKLAAGEQPVAVTFPADLATRLGPGWSVALEDTFGEALLTVVLRDGGGVDEAASGEAAAGWGGDRIALIEGPDGAIGVVLDTAWDTAGDASAFASAAARLVSKLKAAGRSAAVLTPAPSRVVVLTAESGGTLGRLANVLGLAE